MDRCQDMIDKLQEFEYIETGIQTISTTINGLYVTIVEHNGATFIKIYENEIQIWNYRCSGNLINLFTVISNENYILNKLGD